MRLLSIAMALGLFFACEAEPESDAVDSHEAPDPVAPVVVDPSAPQTASATAEGSEATAPAAAGDEEELRTRIAELEEQLAACQAGSAAAPTEVTVRDPAPEPGAANTQSASSARRGRRAAADDADDDRPPSLIDQVLGGDGERRGRLDDDEDGPILLDPSRLLGR